jgi:hypothetical protein
MKIRMLQGIAGADFSLSPGDETERFSQGEAQRMIEAGFAVPVAEQRVERAVKQSAPEKRGAFDHDGDGKPGGSLPKGKKGRR